MHYKLSFLRSQLQKEKSDILMQDNLGILTFFFFLRVFIFKKTLFEKLQYLKQEQ